MKAPTILSALVLFACTIGIAGGRVIIENVADPGRIPAGVHELPNASAQKAYLEMAGFSARIVGEDVYVRDAAVLEEPSPGMTLSEKIMEDYRRSAKRIGPATPAKADTSSENDKADQVRGEKRRASGGRLMSWTGFSGANFWLWIGVGTLVVVVGISVIVVVRG